MMRPGGPGGSGVPGAGAGAGQGPGPGAQCDAMLLGREPVEGAVHAASLASLVRGLAGTKARPNRQGRRYLLRCSDGGVELVARRPVLQRPLIGANGVRADDEGFESDEDRRSTRSDDSTSVSSSCCLVDDHVFKAGAVAVGLPSLGTPATSSTSSDSANSSGGSDTDEVDAKALHETTTIAVEPPPTTAVPFRETFSFQDVAFCHVDASFPRVVVLVVRRAAAPRRLRPASPASGLEALVLECRGEEGVRALCAAYQELSRRVRMDGAYRAPHRRKEEAKEATSNTATTVVSGTMLPKFIFSKVDEVVGVEASRFNLVHRTDCDGVTHIEVSRGTGASMVSVDDVSGSDVDVCGPSSIISISTPDAGNVLSERDRTRLSKEIEGVIRAHVDAEVEPPRPRQRQDEPKLWTTALTADDDVVAALSGPSSLPPPQRPERKRFVRKNKGPAPQAPSSQGGPQQSDGSLTLKKKGTAPSPSSQEGGSSTLSRVGRPEQRVVRGQFIRVSVEQQAKQAKQAKQAWPHVSHFPAGWTGPPPARSATPHLTSHPWGSAFQDAEHRHRYQRRSRSSDSGRGQQQQQQQRPRSPPAAARRPMAYRYIDTPAPSQASQSTRPHHPGATTNSLSNRFFGLSQKLREIGGSVVGGGYPGFPGSGRRNSWGDSPTRFYTSLDPPLKAGGGNNLKSVIKKNQGIGGAEPKKVTFSAYATVQVVD